ncbi:MAG: hypothetical protein AAF340_07540 [Pseudomonadota bacterium]
MAGRALMIPLVLGIFLMGGALGLGFVNEKANAEGATTHTALVTDTAGSPAHQGIASLETPVQHMAPPTVPKDDSSGSFIGQIAGMFRSGPPPEVAEEEVKVPTKTVCTKKKGFKSCKIVQETDE